MQKRIAHNIFEGINPVLNEKLLYQGQWHGFHNLYLAELFKALRIELMTKGYTVHLEETVQIQRFGEKSQLYRPDLLINRLYPTPLTASLPQTQLTIEPTIFLYEDLEEADTDMTAIVIRKNGDDDKPVTWIELLSPTNKAPYGHFSDYQSKRTHIYTMGICFIELDFIHTQPPALSLLPNYSAQDPNASPFHINVFEPHLQGKNERILNYSFGVADKIPTIPVPLEDEDRLIFDFNKPYQKMFEEALYGWDIDYVTDTYHHYQPSDRNYILKRVADALGAEESPT